MDLFYRCYVYSWVAACVLAVILFLSERRSYSIFSHKFIQFLLVPWKTATFIIAALGMILVAPYTGDPTWDYFDAAFMAILTFVTAPWVVGVLYHVIRRRRPVRQGYVAVCVWMFSASWSYDLYILIRDGMYPITWFVNIFASSVLYIAAGLLWSLEWKAGRGTVFSFQEPGWPNPPSDPQFARLLWIALPFMMIAVFAVLSFLLPLF